MRRILPFFQPKVFIDYSHKVLFQSGNCLFIIWVHIPISFILFFLQTDELDDGVQIVPEIESCKSNYMTIFVGCIYATKGLLMVINLIFWQLFLLVLSKVVAEWDIGGIRGINNGISQLFKKPYIQAKNPVFWGYLAILKVFSFSKQRNERRKRMSESPTFWVHVPIYEPLCTISSKDISMLFTHQSFFSCTNTSQC